MYFVYYKLISSVVHNRVTISWCFMV